MSLLFLYFVLSLIIVFPGDYEAGKSHRSMNTHRFYVVIAQYFILFWWIWLHEVVTFVVAVTQNPLKIYPIIDWILLLFMKYIYLVIRMFFFHFVKIHSLSKHLCRMIFLSFSQTFIHNLIFGKIYHIKKTGVLYEIGAWSKVVWFFCATLSFSCLCNSNTHTITI